MLSRDWHWAIGILAVQYLGVFWLVHLHWPINMTAVKLVTGWMACATLGITQLGETKYPASETSWPQGRLFRLFCTGLVWLTTFSVATSTAGWLGIDLTVAWGSLLLIGMGLLHLGITTQPLHVVNGLLTMLSGFEILYATVETSALVAALLAFVTLGLAMTGSILILASSTKEMQ